MRRVFTHLTSGWQTVLSSMAKSGTYFMLPQWRKEKKRKRKEKEKKKKRKRKEGEKRRKEKKEKGGDNAGAAR